MGAGCWVMVAGCWLFVAGARASGLFVALTKSAQTVCEAVELPAGGIAQLETSSQLILVDIIDQCYQPKIGLDLSKRAARVGDAPRIVAQVPATATFRNASR